MTDLSEFLRARLEEDETAARFVWPERYTARVLAQCKAKWQIVELHRGDHYCLLICSGGASCQPICSEPSALFVGDECCDTLRLLALPYADHPHYREEWRP